MGIQEGNKLIMFFDGAENSEFELMGHPTKAIKYKETYYPEWSLPKFNEDWNLLMPIGAKITAINISSKRISLMMPVFKAAEAFDKKALWNACVDFITWYNEQPREQRIVEGL